MQFHLLHEQLLILAYEVCFFCLFFSSRSRFLAAVIIIIVLRETVLAGCEPAFSTAAFAKLARIWSLTSVSRVGKSRIWVV